MAITTYLLIITLNVSGVNAPIKDTWIKKWYTHTQEILCGRKRGKSILSEISQAEKDRYPMIPLTYGIYRTK